MRFRESGNITDGDKAMTLTSNLSPLNCNSALLVEGAVINDRPENALVLNAPSGRTRGRSLRVTGQEMP